MHFRKVDAEPEHRRLVREERAQLVHERVKRVGILVRGGEVNMDVIVRTSPFGTGSTSRSTNVREPEGRSWATVSSKTFCSSAKRT